MPDPRAPDTDIPPLPPLPESFAELLRFPLVEALLGRRSRRFFRGAEIPDGPLAFRSRNAPLGLSEAETLCVLLAMTGQNSWHHLIYRHALYAPHLSNYACAAPGRTFPSAAGFHTSQLFYTDDSGVYFVDTRDAPPPAARDAHGELDPRVLLAGLKGRIRKLSDGRLGLPSELPFVEGHNTWVANRPGTTLCIPIGDASQHMLANLCYYLQNGAVLYDDVAGRPIPGLEPFADLADLDHPLPLSFIEQVTVAEIQAELATSCYAGTLMLQGLGLGGWMFNGLDPFAVLGASGDPRCPGLGFNHATDPRWSVPNVTGLPGVMEGFCPPHYPDMAAAVRALCQRKFGPGGPFNPQTPGPWRDTPGVRGAALAHGERFQACVAAQAQYILDAYGKFPATIPAMWLNVYLQAQHLDTEFYDRFFEPGAYLDSHARHMRDWHPEHPGHPDLPNDLTEES